MDSFNRALIEFVLMWTPFGGPPDDETFRQFGIDNSHLTAQFCHIVAKHWPDLHRYDTKDRTLLRRARQRADTLSPHMPQPGTGPSDSAISTGSSKSTPHQEVSTDSASGRGRNPDGPAWMLSARCGGHDPALFFHPDNERCHQLRESRTQKAKAICMQCQVITQCLEHSLAIPERYGIWGGMTEAERIQLQDRRNVEIDSQFLASTVPQLVVHSATKSCAQPPPH